MFLNLVQQWKERIYAPALAARMDQAGKATVERARELVPVRTGQLRDSISHYYNTETKVLTISAGMTYGYWVEMGTSRTAPHPYLRPAIAEVGRVFGASTQMQFPSVPAKYVRSAKDATHAMKKPRVIIGHRKPAANRKRHGRR